MISSVWAQDATSAAATGNLLNMGLTMALMFGVFYFVVLRPQSTQAKKHTDMLKELKKGDSIMTDGGIVGEISVIKDGFVQIKTGPGTVLTVAKEAVKVLLKDDVAKEVGKLVK